MYIGIDDTDSVEGMCTTYLAALMLEELQRQGIGLLGYPRLVRLNPNIPWKTRGNGALALHVGKVGKERKRIGDRYSIYEGDERCDVFDTVRRVVEQHSRFEDDNTNPGFVVSAQKPSRDLYERCVSDIVELDDALRVLDDIGARYMGYKNRRGLIGAAAAISYEPDFSTYELIAYRTPRMIGKKREIDRRSVMEMDRGFPETFDNYDYENEHVCIAPNSPCPVLFGVRGMSSELSGILEVLRTEDIERWIIYESNQGTDEHLQRKKMRDMRRHTSGIVEGVVKTKPEMMEGGHALFCLSEGDSEMACAAYEPTKQFRDVILRLLPGDIVELYGGMNRYDTFNIEKILVKELKAVLKNPKCCGVSMKSMGKGKGVRCEKCGRRTTAGKEAGERDLKPGFYEVPSCARRHLSMPLKVMSCRYGRM